MQHLLTIDSAHHHTFARRARQFQSTLSLSLYVRLIFFADVAGRHFFARHQDQGRDQRIAMVRHSVLMALCRAVAISSVQRKMSMSVSTHIFDSVQGRLAADAIKRKAAPHGPKRRRFFVRGVAPEESPCRSGESIFHWRTALKTDSAICLIRPVVTRTTQ